MARGIALVIVVPLRLVWDAVAYCLRHLWRGVLAPVGRALGRLIDVLILTPLGWLWRWVVVPVAKALWWLVDTLLLTPLGWLWRWVVVPVARALWWVVDLVVLTPLGWLWRYVLAPVGRVLGAGLRIVGAALAWAWRIAGEVSRAVGRAVSWVLWHAVGRPLAWTYRVVLTPVGHWLRTYALHPAAEVARAVRTATREVWRALFGGPA
ncbi:hypothetical protein [Streptomyces sp. NBC_01268]|uniref:hypothetical protein n=1 Tax=Streptomyces sp. NBC_01268 TaxID=2903806 RepID=UPI002E33D0AC|nr:hypothetical protein [Streptomyces sp. NBC_01268]